jgi:basic membrane lipoprotein Med (substrate-binding protein (PBP1-ABC) superfamily)
MKRVLALLGLTACSMVVEPEPGAGLGASCVTSDECQASQCIDGLCALRCAGPEQCPGGTVCANQVCRLPLASLSVAPYDTQQDRIGQAVHAGVVAAAAELGFVSTELLSGLETNGATYEEVQARLEAARRDVVIITSPTLSQGALELAETFPETTFLAYQVTSSSVGDNLVRFDARSYQAYYLAGFAAGRLSASKRLGFIAGEVRPESIASVNGFYLGALAGSGEPIVMEVSFMEGPHDLGPKLQGKSKERRDTEAMVERGADVIAHNVDNNIPVFTVRDLIDAGESVRAVAAHSLEDCDIVPAGACAGAVTHQWGPLLEPLFDAVHRGEPPTGSFVASILTNDAASVVRFDLGSSLPGGSGLRSELETRRAMLASEAGVGLVFDGPLSSTGQCATEPCVPAETRLDDAGLSSMCWLVAGIVDAAGMPALVPGSSACP